MSQTVDVTTALYYTPLASSAGSGAMTCNLITESNSALTSAYVGKASSLCTASGTAAKINFYFTANAEYEGDLFLMITDAVATTWSPYSNECPISGWDECRVMRAGVNLLPTINATQTISGITWTKNADGSVTLSGTATANSVYDFGRGSLTLKAGTYTTKEQTSGDVVLTVFHVVNGSASVLLSGGGTFTLSQEEPVFLRYFIASGKSVSKTIYPQIELGSTSTSYSPYTGSLYTISLGQTVYGAKADITGGRMVVSKAYKLFVGASDENWSRINSYGTATRFDITINTLKANSGSNAKTNILALGAIGTSGLECFNVHASSSLFQIQLLTSRLSADSVAGLKSWLAQNNIALCYELQTPISISLTPTQITSLKSLTTMYADTGNISVDYAADLKTYILNAISNAL